jgi:hypothetical protein
MERINTKKVFRVEKSTRETDNNSEFSYSILAENKHLIQKKTCRAEG